MLANQITTKNYAGTNQTFTKRFNDPTRAVFRCDASTATDITEIEIRYIKGKARRLTYTNIIDQQGVNQIITPRKTIVKVLRRVYDVNRGWEEFSYSQTFTVDDIRLMTDATLKDTLAYAANIPLTSALFTQLLNEEV